MTAQPFLQSQFENRLWRRLNGGGLLGKYAATSGAVQSAMADIAEHEGKIGSSLLMSLMEHLSAEGGASFDSLSRIVLKSRPRDCMASVRASEIMLDKGDINAARELLSMSSGSKEILHRELMEARISHAEGDLAAVKEHAMNAFGADPACMDVYDLLEKADPDGGWGVKRSIQDILAGRKPSGALADGSHQLLYNAYYEWFCGSREAATDLMVRSRHRTENDPDFILASARMSADEKDWRSAAMMYGRLISDAPPFLLREAAEAVLRSGDPAHALELLQRSDQTHPDTMKGYVHVYSEMGRTAEMMDSLRSYLDCEWSRADDWIESVLMLLDRGMAAEAQGLLSMYTEGMGWDPAALTCRSALQMASGEYPGALMSASEAVQRDKDSIPARVQLARVKLAMGKGAAAQRDCDRILVQDPGNKDALRLMRDMHSAAGDHQRAVGICRRILDEDPSDAQAMMDLADAMLLAGQKGDAIDMWNRALRLDGSREAYVRAAGSMIRAGLCSDATFVCRDGEKLHPQDPMLKRLRGNAEYTLGEYFKASVAYADALGIDNGNPVLWYSKGMADEMRGDLESAESAYRRAVSLDVSEPEYRIALSAMSEARGDDVAAVRHLNDAISLDPTDPYPIRRKAAVFAKHGRTEEAIGLLDMALSCAPRDKGCLEEKMACQYSLHDYDGALDSFLLIDGPSEKSVVRAADCYASKNMRDKALQALNAAISRIGPTVALTDALSRYSSDHAEHVWAEAAPAEEKAEDPVEEPEPRPAVKKKEPETDPEGQFSMAASLLAAEDCEGAMRAVDRALSADPDEPRYIALKAEIALASGDADGASFLAASASKAMPDDPQLHFIIGRARAAKGDLKGALQAYDTAISLGMDDARVHLAKADAYDALGIQDKAAESYSAAFSRDPGMLDTGEKLARIMISRRELIAADSVVSKILRRDPSRVSAILMKAEIASKRADSKALESAYDMYLSCGTQTSDATVALARMMEEAGLATEARDLVAGKADQQVGDPVKRYAEKALRRAYTMKQSPTDPDVMGFLGLDQAMSAKVSTFLTERRDVGTIAPGTDAFREMERRSLDAVTKLQWKDLEKNPDLPLAAVYVQCGFKDVDAAKDLVAYIKRAMLTDIGRRADPRLAEMSLGLPKGMTVYEIMLECSIGVYEARVVQSQII